MLKVSIILPTYNEKGHIIDLVNALLDAVTPPLEIFVMDDKSPDGTYECVAEAFAGDDRVLAVSRDEEPGLAYAIGDGVRRSSGDYIVVMDTDFSHDPNLVPIMVENLAHFDVVSGSRFIHGGGMYSEGRYTFSYIFNLFCRFALGTRLTDHLSGYLAVRRSTLNEVLDRVPEETIFHGYGDYYIRLMFHFVKMDKTILELPSWYEERTYGESKTRFLKTLIRYAKTVIGLRFRYGKSWRKRRLTP